MTECLTETLDILSTALKGIGRVAPTDIAEAAGYELACEVSKRQIRQLRVNTPRGGEHYDVFMVTASDDTVVNTSMLHLTRRDILWNIEADRLTTFEEMEGGHYHGTMSTWSTKYSDYVPTDRYYFVVPTSETDPSVQPEWSKEPEDD